MRSSQQLYLSALALSSGMTGSRGVSSCGCVGGLTWGAAGAGCDWAGAGCATESATGCDWPAGRARPWRLGARAGDCLQRRCAPEFSGSGLRRRSGLAHYRLIAGTQRQRWSARRRGELRAVFPAQTGPTARSDRLPTPASCPANSCGWRGRRGPNCGWLRGLWHSNSQRFPDHHRLRRCTPYYSRKRRCRDRDGRLAGNTGGLGRVGCGSVQRLLAD